MLSPYAASVVSCIAMSAVVLIVVLQFVLPKSMRRRILGDNR